MGRQANGAPGWRRRREAPSAPREQTGPGGCAPCQATTGARTEEPCGSAAVRTSGPARGELNGLVHRQELDAEDWESPISLRGPEVTAVRDGPDAGDARGREVCALRALEAKAAGYTSLVCTDGRASVEKLLAPLSLQLRVQCLEIAERKIPKSRKKHTPPSLSLLDAPAPLSLLSRKMLWELRVSLRKSNAFCKARRGGFI